MPTSLNPELVKGRLLRLTLTRLQIQKHQSQQSEEAVPSALSPDCDPGHRKSRRDCVCGGNRRGSLDDRYHRPEPVEAPGHRT